MVIRKIISKTGLYLCITMIVALAFMLNGCGGGGSGDGGGSWGGGGGGGSTPSPTDTTPTVTSCSMTTSVPGSECTINGSGFGKSQDGKASASYVSFINSNLMGGSQDAISYTYWSDTKIKCITPNLVAGQNYTVAVYVISSSGSATGSSTTASSANTITVQAGSNTPSVSSISPTSVNEASGAALTILGSNFGTSQATGSYVAFTGSSGTSIQSNSTTWTNTQIICSLPSTVKQGTASVYVHTDSGGNSSSSSLTINSATTPAITKVSPAYVNQSSTTPITILGSNLGDTAGSVYYGSTQQANCTSWSSTQVVCTLPTSVTAATTTVSVKTSSGVTTNTLTFTVVSATAPTIVSISPSSISSGSSTPISITGTNLGTTQGTGYVSFGTTQQTSVTSWSNTLVVCTVPTSVTTSASVKVRTSAGTDTNEVTLNIGSTGGKIYAIFVGINAYPSNPLNYCVNDVTGMKSSLTSCNLWSTASVTTLTDAQATKSAILSAISSVGSQVTSSDTFMFYYSGHGSSLSGKAYIIPVDSTGQASSCISDTELYTYLSAINTSAKKFIVLDSCYSGGFISKDPGLKARYVPLVGSVPEFKGGGFLKALENLSNEVTLCASSGSQTSLESSGLQHGVFTNYIIDGFGNGATIGPADTTSAGFITGEWVFNYASPKTIAYVSSLGRTQTPQMSNNYTGNMVIKQ